MINGLQFSLVVNFRDQISISQKITIDYRELLGSSFKHFNVFVLARAEVLIT